MAHLSSERAVRGIALVELAYEAQEPQAISEHNPQLGHGDVGSLNGEWWES